MAFQENLSPVSDAVRAVVRDDAPSLLTRGYDFGARIWRRVAPGARSAPMRLLGDDALLMRGAEGVALFYDEERVARHGAMPAILRECGRPECTQVYLDRSRGHRREWCSMKTCGNRVKASAFRARQRAATAS